MCQLSVLFLLCRRASLLPCALPFSSGIPRGEPREGSRWQAGHLSLPIANSYSCNVGNSSGECERGTPVLEARRVHRSTCNLIVSPRACERATGPTVVLHADKHAMQVPARTWRGQCLNRNCSTAHTPCTLSHVPIQPRGTITVPAADNYVGQRPSAHKSRHVVC